MVLPIPKQPYFNPRSPHGERPTTCADCPTTRKISIHAPRTGSDVSRCRSRSPTSAFQSTLPARGATSFLVDNSDAMIISIHAPRTGSDLRPPSGLHRHKEFQSTLPARGATSTSVTAFSPTTFQSTLPARGATGNQAVSKCQRNRISIHAPRTGSDSITGKTRFSCEISIHAPRTGSDGHHRRAPCVRGISIHAPRTGSDVKLTFF